jgi:hypothetical protein
LTLGLDLKEMEIADMLDVVHYLFEEDSRYRSQEEAESVSAVRTQVYETLYGTTYRYKMSKSQTSNTNVGSTGLSDSDIKPYIPPTDFDPGSYKPFGSVLEAPIG